MELGCITLLLRRSMHQPGSYPNCVVLGLHIGFVTKARPIINSVSTSFSLSGKWEMGLEISSL